MSETSLRFAAWLLTYALHSTVLLGAAALLTARRGRAEAWRETLWKAALVGGLVTATVQSAGWIAGDLGAWRLAALAPPRPAAEASPGASPTLAKGAEAGPPRETSPAPAPAVPENRVSAPTTPSLPAASAPAAPRLPGTPLGWALLAWGVAAAGMLLRLGLRQARLRRLLAGRKPVEDEAVLAMLAGLRRHAGIWRPVHLTACAATPTPLALGSGEICVPPRFLADLDPEQQRTALAHELAHLARRDPAWHVAVSIVEALFFFQPLNRVARARLRESAEFLCDEWAARQTGSPLGLARCLAEVASWVAPGRDPIPAGTMAMAEGGSPLVQRVQRLTSWRGAPRGESGVLRIAAAVALVGAVAALAPAIASTEGGGRGESPRTVGAAPASPLAENGQEIVVIRHPDPGQPLADRWAWAVGQIGERRMGRAWIAYSVPTRLSPGEAWFTDSGDFSMSAFDRAPLARALRAPEDQAVLLFSATRDGAVHRVSGRNAVGMELGGAPVLWLGPAEGAASFAWLRRMADGMRDPDQRESLVELIGIHDGAEVVPYLAATLGRDGSNGVRREAASGLARHPSDEALAALRTAVERDGAQDVRREGVEAIGRLGTPGSLTLLHTLAIRGHDEEIRRAAVEALGAAPDERAMETLIAIAAHERSAVAREAVESMEEGPAGVAAPALVRLAWTVQDQAVARQAAESLGRLPAAWAVVALDSVARLHPDAAVAKQAVESLAGYPDAVAGGYLRQIARTHPDPRVRAEALDQLRRARGDSGSFPDPVDPGHDPDPNVDPGLDPDPEWDPGSDPDPDPDPAAEEPSRRTDAPRAP